jgi:hypothetical protein
MPAEVFSEFAEAERYYQKVLDRAAMTRVAGPGWAFCTAMGQLGDVVARNPSPLELYEALGGEFSTLLAEGQFQTFIMSLAADLISKLMILTRRPGNPWPLPPRRQWVQPEARRSDRWTGLVCFQAEEYAEAVKTSAKALLVKGGRPDTAMQSRGGPAAVETIRKRSRENSPVY